MADSDSSLPFYKLLAMDLSSQIILAAIVVVLLVIIFIIVLHHYSKRYWTRRSETNITQTSVSLNLGLEPSVIKSLPIFTFNFDQFKDGLECSVCLCELSLGDKIRLLPKCNHGFHIDCIDMWFQSHSTCPLCRNPISPESSSSSNPSLESPSQEISISGLPPNYPTNILFWGNQTQISEGSSSSSSFSVSSSSSSLSSKRVDKTLVIELPNRVTDSFSLSSSSSPPSTSRFSEEQLKPSMSTRLRSLRKLLGGEKRIVPHSSSIVDIEQGEEGRRVQQNSKISSNFRSCYTNSSSNGIYPSEDMNT